MENKGPKEFDNRPNTEKMRNEKLRNELNEMPREFDRERIWEGIELPKKKRKRRGLLWLFGLGIILMGLAINFIVEHKYSGSEDINSRLPDSAYASDKQEFKTQENHYDEKREGEKEVEINQNNSNHISTESHNISVLQENSLTDKSKRPERSGNVNEGGTELIERGIINDKSGKDQIKYLELSKNKFRSGEKYDSDSSVSQEMESFNDSQKEKSIGSGMEKSKNRIDDIKFVSLPFNLEITHYVKIDQNISILKRNEFYSRKLGLSAFTSFGNTLSKIVI